ncbi:MAG: Holliday junction branch migration protein RuvA [Corynebacterium sp.]|nr:Holliday junction branch migration protein RuvA [Corynebacterium sp.]
MIVSLRGEVIDIALDSAVIECGGIGYKFLATPQTLGQLHRGEQALMLTSMVVKDDGMTLYGFTSPEDRGMFHRLQSVSGLGPKLALASLSLFSADELAIAVTEGDTKKLQRIAGVGKRMAERMALELRDKVKEYLPAATSLGENGQPLGGGQSVAHLPIVDTVIEALVGLGFVEKTARPVVEGIVAQAPESQSLDTATVLRAALSSLSRGK